MSAPIGDVGWTYQHDRAARGRRRNFGDKVETAYPRKRAGRPRRRARHRALRPLRLQHHLHHLVRLHGRRPTRSPAKFPDVKFEHATGYKREPPNVATYNSRFYEGRYIQGQIAAKMSKAGVAGYIASFPIPEVVMGINAFMLGAQSVNPGLQAQGRLGQHLVRPRQGSRRRQGADRPGRRHHHPAHRLDRADAGCRRARHQGLRPGLRHDQVRPEDAADLDRRHWGPYYIERIKAVIDGTWTAGRRLGRPEGRHVVDGALHQHARRREGDGRWRPRPRSSRASSSRSPARSPSRTAPSG